MTNYSNIYILSLPTIHMKCMYNEIWRGGCEGKWLLSIGVDSDTFTSIKDRAPYHAWGLGGWVNDRPLRCCGISIVMKIFALFTVLTIVSETMLFDTVYTMRQRTKIGHRKPQPNQSWFL